MSTTEQSSLIDQNDAGEHRYQASKTGVLAMLDRTVEAIALILFVIMMAAVLIQVGARFLAIPILWTEELARVLLVVSAVLAMAIGVRRREHIIVDYFVDRLGSRSRRVVSIAMDILILGFLVIWLRGAINLARLNADTVFVTVPWLSVSVLYWAEIVSILLMMLFILADLIAKSRARKPLS